MNAPSTSIAQQRRKVEATELPGCIAELVDQAADAAGARLAWSFFEEDETMTYAALRDRVHRLANALFGVGIAKGTHVALMAPNLPQWPLTWLALGTVGAVTVPVNNAYTARELAYVLNDSDATWLIVHAEALATYEAARAEGQIALPPERVIVIAGDIEGGYNWEALFEAAPADRHVPASPLRHDDLLNIQYTSGTTGFPKGCMLTQRYWLQAGLVNAFRDGLSYERILASTPFFYMDPQWLLLMTLYHRATLFVARRQSASRFLSWVREHGINFCLMPVILMKQPERPDDGVNEIVRANVYVMPPALHAPFESRFNVRAREAFGMTEVGPTMFMPIGADDMVGSGSCGIPGPFRECAVVDESDRPLPPGEVGQLVIRGPGMLLGYYKRPDATAEAMRNGWFHTGDLARVDGSGYFYIVGRIKDTIRRSAENIAAREVEAVLLSYAAVTEAAAIPVPDPARGEEVKACLVLRDGLEPDEALLRGVIAHCEANLAPFKVPRFYEFRSALPKTPSLKIAKQTLVAERDDLRVGAYDRTVGAWIEGTGA